ncbi:hypothetical protein ACRAWG_10420 [Methylobacterium sp. P31]
MSMDRDAEFQRLNEADGHIANGERRVMRQRLVLASRRANGQGTAEAERLLRMMEESLEEYREHRQLTLEMIAQIDAGLARPKSPERAFAALMRLPTTPF